MTALHLVLPASFQCEMKTDQIWNEVRDLPQRKFLQHPGRMPAAILSYDWSTTSIGPIDTWPVSLRSVVQMAVLSRQPICLVWGPDLNFIYNDAYAPILGLKENGALGQPFEQLWSDVWEDISPIVHVAMSGTGTWHQEMPLVMMRNGFDEETFWSFSYSPLYDDTGRIAGMINITTDTTSTVDNRERLSTSYDAAKRKITEQAEFDAQQRIIQREMSHRIKNIISMTMSVVSQTLRHTHSVSEARDIIGQRLTALADAQDILTTARFAEAQVHALVTQVMKPHIGNGSRAKFSGPDFTIPAQTALGMALAIHELATNAVKYGALSNDSGKVSLDWTLSSDGAFRLEWTEAGGPEVRTPVRSGFGSRLMGKVVPAYFSGTGETFYDADGLRYVLTGRVDPVDVD